MMWYIVFLASLIIQYSALEAAVYNLPSFLINIPVARPIMKGDLSAGISTGFTSVAESAGYEFDLSMNYAVSNQLQLGMTMVNQENLVLNLNYAFLNSASLPLRVVGGVTDITINGQDTLTHFSEYPIIQKTAMSPYVVGSFETKVAIFHAGYGGERFQYFDKGKAKLEGLKGFIFGIEIPIKISRISLEYDGKDFNLGGAFPIGKYTVIHAAFTELGHVSNINPQYNNQPVRFFSFGVHRQFNRSKPDQGPQGHELYQNQAIDQKQLDKALSELRDSFQSEINAWKHERQGLVDELNRLKISLKEDIAFIDETDDALKEELRQHYLSTNQDISEKILRYYYQSFVYFSDNQHQQAIEVLQKALQLNPYLPQIYSRLGSIYYDLKLDEMAIRQWEKAIELDPYNLGLQKVLTQLKSPKQH